MRLASLLCAGLFAIAPCVPHAADATSYLLRPQKVWTGDEAAAHTGWAVLVRDGVVLAAGDEARMTLPPDTQRIDLPGATLTPGLIDLHSHLFLHPYNETSWNDQVLKEPTPYRTLKAAQHARDTLLSGFTALRDSGHGRRRLCRRVGQARDRRRHDPRTAPVRRHACHRRQQ